jgi:hypothetical protein
VSRIAPQYLLGGWHWKNIMNQELLTVTQFKERYQISHTAFYRQVQTGKLRIIKIGASTRVAVGDAQSWLASLTSSATERNRTRTNATVTAKYQAVTKGNIHA